jgi:hypothetical protein
MASDLVAFGLFGFHEEGIHLLRGGYCYKKIPFSALHTLTLKKGKAVNNWFLLFLIGTGIIFANLFLIDAMFYFEEGVLVIDTRLSIFLASLCAIVVGAYMIKQAFKTALV